MAGEGGTALRFVLTVVRVGVAVMGVLGADDFVLYGWSEDSAGDLGDADSRFLYAALEIAAAGSATLLTSASLMTVKTQEQKKSNDK